MPIKREFRRHGICAVMSLTANQEAFRRHLLVIHQQVAIWCRKVENRHISHDVIKTSVEHDIANPNCVPELFGWPGSESRHTASDQVTLSGRQGIQELSAASGLRSTLRLGIMRYSAFGSLQHSEVFTSQRLGVFSVWMYSAKVVDRSLQFRKYCQGAQEVFRRSPADRGADRL